MTLEGKLVSTPTADVCKAQKSAAGRASPNFKPDSSVLVTAIRVFLFLGRKKPGIGVHACFETAADAASSA